jgi:hypothetical protein
MHSDGLGGVDERLAFGGLEDVVDDECTWSRLDLNARLEKDRKGLPGTPVTSKRRGWRVRSAGGRRGNVFGGE